MAELVDAPALGAGGLGHGGSSPSARILEPSHDQTIERAFSEQARGFNASAVANAGEILEAIVEHARPGSSERDFDDWLQRGTRDPAAHALVERVVGERPNGSECFEIRGGRGSGAPRTLTLQIWLGAWRRC